MALHNKKGDFQGIAATFKLCQFADDTNDFKQIFHK